MAAIPDIVAGLNIRDDDEGLFSRDISGQLVRLDAPTESDYTKSVTLQIDGQTVTVPMAEPLADANGSIIVDIDGRTTPRYTTIFDAATKLYVKKLGDADKIPIPTLCHQSHMTPVAVCRLCVVQIYGQKRGKRAAERKLLPACQHPVKEGMEVFTMNAEGPDGDRVRSTVKVMTELLTADNLRPVEQPTIADELAPYNELGQMAQRCGAKIDRFKLDVMSAPKPVADPHVARRSWDASSPVFLVDHAACILCERCIRACGEVKDNNVIGRTGKGATAGIGFDFNDLMGQSSCVKCGECMVSCPTSAITYKANAQIALKSPDRSSKVVPAQELLSDPTFAGIPPKFLLWQKGLVISRRYKKGDTICEQGEAGNTAFLIKSGRLEVNVLPKKEPSKQGIFSKLLGGGDSRTLMRFELTPDDLIVGEMACMSGIPRSATVKGLEGGEVWEVRRNVLDRLMRLPGQREQFEKSYRARSLDLVLQEMDLFRGIPDQEYIRIVEHLRERLTFVRVKPGQNLFGQGDRVDDLFVVRLGHVRVAVTRFGNETKVISAGPGAILGEIGLLALTPGDVVRDPSEVDASIHAALVAAGDDLANGYPSGIRTSTCTALGHLELARLNREDFLRMIRDSPSLRHRLVKQSLARLRSDDLSHPLLREFVEQGLYEARSLLVLDTDLCTRCDECTKGCVQQHGTESHGVPLTRMLRDGLRFDRFLVATACRSCADPHCMFGCPVDSIHRGRHLQIVIEDHCIGCGLCAQNCPYGNIFMVPNERSRIEMPDPERPGKSFLLARPKAVTCDLCDSEGHRETPKPRCVAACPHEAASRMTGDALLNRVIESSTKARSN